MHVSRQEIAGFVPDEMENTMPKIAGFPELLPDFELERRRRRRRRRSRSRSRSRSRD